MNWSLLPTAAIFNSVLPGEYISGSSNVIDLGTIIKGVLTKIRKVNIFKNSLKLLYLAYTGLHTKKETSIQLSGIMNIWEQTKFCTVVLWSFILCGHSFFKYQVFCQLDTGHLKLQNIVNNGPNINYLLHKCV